MVQWQFVIVVFSSSIGAMVVCWLALALLWRLPMARHGDDLKTFGSSGYTLHTHFCWCFSFVVRWLLRDSINSRIRISLLHLHGYVAKISIL